MDGEEHRASTTPTKKESTHKQKTPEKKPMGSSGS